MSRSPSRGAEDGHRRRRLDRLVAAGLIDSFGLALGWTVFLLHAVAAHGLGTAAAYSAAMLVGIALSAPVAGVVAARLDGRRLLRSTAVVEAALRGGVFALLLLGAAASRCSPCSSSSRTWSPGPATPGCGPRSPPSRRAGGARGRSRGTRAASPRSRQPVRRSRRCCPSARRARSRGRCSPSSSRST